MRLVVKFGGTSIKTVGRVRAAARNVARMCAAGNQVLVVVSAMGDATNRLMRRGREAWAEAPFDQNYLRLLATGESQSAAVMAMALCGEGQQAGAIGFDHPRWPVVAAPGQTANQRMSAGKVNDVVDVRLDEAESYARFSSVVEPMLAAGMVPVFPGFFIREAEAGLVTLGRGGSDVAAFLVGRFARADEVVIVTDVKGVLSADPRVVKDARVLPDMSAEVLSAVAHRGAQVLHPNALRYKPDSVAARVVHFRDLRRAAFGTRITGAAKTRLTLHPEPLTQVLLFRPGLASRTGVLGQIGSWLSEREIPIHATTSSDTVVGLYVESGRVSGALTDLHAAFTGPGRAFDELLSVGPVAELTLSNPAFVEVPGVISAVADTLGRGGLVIVEMVTTHADVVVYCRWSDRERAEALLRERLGLGGNGPRGTANGGRGTEA
ncbi:MAG: hypothetical protein FJ087_18425 [Deltaproteobacteria bacterium]|nr:hypothetical protein [Deltaproteobacteria bacterium]